VTTAGTRQRAGILRAPSIHAAAALQEHYLPLRLSFSPTNVRDAFPRAPAFAFAHPSLYFLPTLPGWKTGGWPCHYTAHAPSPRARGITGTTHTPAFISPPPHLFAAASSCRHSTRDSHTAVPRAICRQACHDPSIASLIALRFLACHSRAPRLPIHTTAHTTRRHTYCGISRTPTFPALPPPAAPPRQTALRPTHTDDRRMDNTTTWRGS